MSHAIRLLDHDEPVEGCEYCKPDGVKNYYQDLMVFVAQNFICASYPGASAGGPRTELHCKQHGNIWTWEHQLHPGEIAMMKAIGIHLDEVKHEGV